MTPTNLLKDTAIVIGTAVTAIGLVMAAANATPPSKGSTSTDKSSPASIASGVGVGVGVGIGKGGDGGSASAKQLNKQQLASIQAIKTGDTNVTVDQRTDNDNDYWWAYGAGIGAGNNAVPSTGNFEGTRNVTLSGPLGIGFNIPMTMHDDAAIYGAFGNDVLAAWSDKAPANRETNLRRSLLCNMVAGVKESVEDVGLACPADQIAARSDYPE